MNQPGGKEVLFSVIVPTFERPRQLMECLESLAGQTLPKMLFEVVVVVDGGSQSLEQLAHDFGGRLRIKALRQSNGGCASARQLGIDHARGEYLAFTDDDCRPASDWLSRLQDVLMRTPDHGVAGRTINGATDNLYAEATQSIVETLMISGCDTSLNLRYAPTHNIAFPRAHFLAMGGLDRTWRIAGGEDRDLCARWNQAGFRLVYESSMKVFHFHRLSLRGFLRQHFNYGRGAWLYYTREGTCDRFESPRLYPSLLLAPFRHQRAGRAIAIFGLVLLAQLATAGGLLVQTVRRRPVARKPISSETSLGKRVNTEKRAG